MKIFDTKYLKELFKLALPIIMGNLGIVLLGAADCLVAGRYSTQALASVSIANAIHSIVLMLGIGLTSGVSPLLSNKRGEKVSAKKYFFPSIRFALLLSVLLMAITFSYIPLLDNLGFEPSLLKDIKAYTFVVGLTIFAVELHVVLKEFLQAYEIVFIPNLLTILSVFLNLFLNYAFVFGKFGFPELGVVGLAVATGIVRITNSSVLLGFCLYNFKFKNYKEKDYYHQLVKIGLPISAATMIEFFAFNYIAIVLGKISGAYAAAHNIILTFINVSFMIPFSISNALAVKVGYTNGAKNYSEMFKYIKNALGIVFLFMLLASICFILFTKPLVSVFTTDKNLLKLIIPIVPVIALFQLTDGLQATLGGIFRGLKKTQLVMVANFMTYLVVGISLGTYLGIYKKLYLLGCWCAICVSSFLLSTILITYLIKTLKPLIIKKV
ncbi:MATE family efflux transporter [bacterium]|nr:MATE family efflux transporter [bacterium]